MLVRLNWKKAKEAAKNDKTIVAKTEVQKVRPSFEEVLPADEIVTSKFEDP